MQAPSPRVAPLEPEQETTGRSLAVIGSAQAASVLLDPTRQRILEHLRHPGSATTLSAALGMSRQLANYHVRALERAGLVEEVERKRRRGCQERVVRATAARYLLSPDALSESRESPSATADHFSASYQVATAARTIREVAELAGRAGATGTRLATLTIDTEVRFARPADLEAFGRDLLDAVMALVARYHAPAAANGHRYRLFAGSHPKWEAGDRTDAP